MNNAQLQKARLITDLYSDGNKTVLEQKLETMAVKKLCFEGFRTDEENEQVIDLMFIVELRNYGIVRLTHKIGYFSEEERYNLDSSLVVKFDRNNDILITDIEPALNFEPCFDFITDEDDPNRYIVYAAAQKMIDEKESIILVKMALNFNQFLYMNYVISRYQTNRPYYSVEAADAFTLPLKDENIYIKGEITNIYIPNEEEIENARSTMDESEVVLVNCIAIINFSNKYGSRKIGLYIEDVRADLLSKFIYGSKIVVDSQEDIFDIMEKEDNILITNTILFGNFLDTKMEQYVSYIAGIGGCLDHEDFSLKNKDLFIIPHKTKAKILEYMTNYKLKKTDKKI